MSSINASYAGCWSIQSTDNIFFLLSPIHVFLLMVTNQRESLSERVNGSDDEEIKIKREIIV
jgi:hypothetical protein